MKDNVTNQAKKLVEFAKERARQPAPFVPKTREEIMALVQQHLDRIKKIIGSNIPDRSGNGELQFDQADYNPTDGTLHVPTTTGSEIGIMVVPVGVTAPDGQDYSDRTWRDMEFYMDMNQVFDVSPTEVMVVNQN
jgi:hypothetical protein